MKKLFSIIFLSILFAGMLPIGLFAAGETNVERCKIYCDAWKAYIPDDASHPKPAELPGVSCICNPLEVDSVQKIIAAVQNWIFTIALVIAPLMIVLGAFYILTSAGEPSRVQKGRSIIIWAAIGLAVVLLAKVLYSVIVGVIGG